MATANDQTSSLAVNGVGHKVTNIWFRPNGVSSPVLVTGLGGAYVSTLTRTGVGTYLATLTGFSPKALISCEGYAFDNANPTDSDARVGLVTLSPSTKTVTLVLYVNTAISAVPALKDIAVNAASIVKFGLQWKMFSGNDASGL